MAPKRATTTIPIHRQLSPDSQSRLAIALGYNVTPGEACETPYMKAILSHWPGKGTLDQYVQLFVQTIEYFTSECYARKYGILSYHCVDPNYRGK